jgi:ribosomal subunit interface protein
VEGTQPRRRGEDEVEARLTRRLDRHQRVMRRADHDQSGRSARLKSLKTMTFPIQITFHHMDRSEALEQAIHEKAVKLGRFHPAITQVHVSITCETRHSSKGRDYKVRLDVHVKGKEYAITRQADEDAFVAARDAFDAVRRVLDEELDSRRGYVKQH